MKFALLISTILLTLVILAACSNHQTISNNRVAFWGPPSRSPASFNPDETLDTKLLQDYFVVDSMGKRVRFDLTTDFLTDKDNQYLADKGREVVEKTLLQTVGGLSAAGDAKVSATALLKQNLTKNFINAFIKTLRIYKVANGTFQFNINFTPKADSSSDYSLQLSTNQLVGLSETGRMAQLLSQPEIKTPHAIIEANIPVSDELYQYVGGHITLWIKVLDMNWSPTNVPSIKKNAVKGYVRFKRFYRINQPKEIPLEGVTISSQQGDAQYMTVDLYRKFNLAGMLPKLDRMEISYGKLIFNYFDDPSFFSKIFPKKREEITSGKFALDGVDSSSGKEKKYSVDLSRLEYDFESEQFAYRAFDLANSFSNNRQRNLAKKLRNSLIEGLQLERFTTRIQ
jgi:hypothetical protein